MTCFWIAVIVSFIAVLSTVLLMAIMIGARGPVRSVEENDE